MRRSSRPTRITDAAPSRGEQLRHRELRYVTMMSLRVVCLVLIVILVSAHAPLVWLWVPVLLFGMFIVPWLAVILANERPPKAKYRLATKLHGQPAAEAAPEQAITATEHKVIEPDE